MNMECLEIEDKIELFIQEAKEDAKKNTELPIGMLIKFPFSRIVNVILNMWRRENT